MYNKQKVKEIVINYLITDVCDYHCKHCFTDIDFDGKPNYMGHSVEDHCNLIKRLYDFFQPDNPNNPLGNRLDYSQIRLNVTGGEPLLVPNIDLIFAFASKIGFNPSIITNANNLSEDMVLRIGPHLRQLGISLYACTRESQIEFGAVTRHNKYASLDNVRERVAMIRKVNPNIRVKINTIITKFNYNDDFTQIIEDLNPEKWTLIKPLEFYNREMGVSFEDFNAFTDRYKEKFKHCLTIELGDSFVEAFIMVLPDGRFFSCEVTDDTGNNTYSQKFDDIGMEKAFYEVFVNYRKYQDHLYIM